MMQTSGQLAGCLQASAGVDNKGKMIPGLLAQEPGVRTAPSSLYNSEDHL